MYLSEINYVYSSLGIIRYFQADRCFNDSNIYKFNGGKIKAEELVTFDCGLMELREIPAVQAENTNNCGQILDVIVRPEITRNYFLENNKKFEFCGYDLVDVLYCISAVTNCGAGFENAVNYSELNSFGLFSDYRKAVNAQLDLNDKYNDDSHSCCEIVEIWRFLI